MARAEISRDGSALTVRVPLTFRKRGGHKLVIAPNGSDSWAPPRPRVDNAIVKAIGRAFRWRKLLETGTHATIAEIAAAEKINASYVGRVLRLTLLSPEIVEAILEGRQPADLQLEDLLRPFPGRVEGAASRDLGPFSLTRSRAVPSRWPSMDLPSSRWPWPPQAPPSAPIEAFARYKVIGGGRPPHLQAHTARARSL
jgi:hypothetical protein